MKIDDVEIFEIEGIMHLSFSCLDNSGKHIENEILNLLISDSVKTNHDWHALDIYVDVRWDQKNNRLQMREKNNSTGMYGRASYLIGVPSLLLSKGLITAEDMTHYEKIIANSQMVADRNNKMVIPSYLQPRK